MPEEEWNYDIFGKDKNEFVRNKLNLDDSWYIGMTGHSVHYIEDSSKLIDDLEEDNNEYSSFNTGIIVRESITSIDLPKNIHLIGMDNKKGEERKIFIVDFSDFVASNV